MAQGPVHGQQIEVTQEQLEQIMKAQNQSSRPPAVKTAVNMTGADGKPHPFMVHAKDCVDESHLHKNMAENIKLIDEWVEVCRPNKGRVLVVSAGPSTEKYMDIVRKERAEGTLIVCVKHSLPMLVNAGIIPDACVILDPRDIEGTSTHNIKRTELFKVVPKDTVFFIASMTNPGVTKYLQKKGARIKGWVAECASVKEYFKFNQKWAVVGGSCSAIRAVTLFKAMGFSDFALLGFDCCLYDLPDDIGAKLDNGRPKYINIEVNGKKYLTTGELLALVQDLERLMAFPNLDFMFEVLGDGVVADMFAAYKPKPSYEEMLERKVESWNA